MDCAELSRQIVVAGQRIADQVVRTRLMHAPGYSRRTGAQVYFKCENLQTTGSFKLRGALNKFLTLNDASRQRGVVAASTGNHGRAVAHAARELQSRCTIFAPANADPNKLEATVVALPGRDDVLIPVEEQLIVEFCSR